MEGGGTSHVITLRREGAESVDSWVPAGCLATARRGEMEAASGRERQAREYLEKHGIMELLNHLTTVLLFFRPGKSLASYLAGYRNPVLGSHFPVKILC